MEPRVNVERVWRKIWRRFWSGDWTASGRMSTNWRRVSRSVPKNYSPPSLYPHPSTDPQLITYTDCEAFFELVTSGFREDLIETLNTHGPAVTTELSKSYNEHGKTPLQVAIQQGNLDVVKFLVGKLDVPIGQIGRLILNGVEYLDVPALYVAIVCGELDIAAYLLSIEVRTDQQTTKMIDSIVSSPNGRQEKINILELMGAVNLYFYETDPAPRNGLVYWRAAMHLRHSTVDGEPAIPKTNLPSDAYGVAFGLPSEFTTLEQLEQLSRLELFIQAVLVSQRVLDMVHPGPNIFNLAFLSHWASICSFRQGQSGRAIHMLMYVLQQSQALEHWKGFKTSEIINWALDIMETSIINLQERPGPEEFPFASFMAMFNFASQYMSHLQENRRLRKIDRSTLLGLASVIVIMIFSATELMPQLTAEDRQQFQTSLSLFIAKDHRWGKTNQNLLHTVCHLKSIDHMFAEIHDLLDSDSDSGSESDVTDDDMGSSSSDLDETSDMDYSEFDSSSDTGNDLPDINKDSVDDDLIDSPEVDCDISASKDEDGASVCSDDSDVSGCPSCGHNGEMSSDESDDENFELIRDYRNDGDDDPSEDLTLSVTRLILRLGADPNAADSQGATPLHLLAMNRGNLAQSRLLLEYGAHINQTDGSRLTPLMLFQEWHSQITSQGNPDLNLQFLIGCALPLPLSCLASQVLRKSGIPFDEEKVPPTLQSFIQRH